MRVLYIPTHVNGDQTHPDCEPGVVSSVNDLYAFVKYDTPDTIMVTGDEDITAKATDPMDLIILNPNNP